MVLAEPGTPYAGAAFAPGADAAALLAQAVSDTRATIATSRDRFHCNLRWVMVQLWPGKAFDAQLRRVWITEGRLCSVDDEIGGPVRPDLRDQNCATRTARPELRDQTCADRYLRAQIAALPQASVVAFGGKAQHYLRRMRLPHLAVDALAPPGANHHPARPIWQAAIAAVQARRTTSPGA